MTQLSPDGELTCQYLRGSDLCAIQNYLIEFTFS